MKKLQQHKHFMKVAIVLSSIVSILVLGNDELCIYKRITGLPCPGCGMTRAFLSFFRGDIGQAFYYHPLFWLVPMIFGVYVFKDNARVRKIFDHDRLWQVLLVSFIGVYVIRMVVLFPHVEPMDFNADALIPKIISYLYASLH